MSECAQDNAEYNPGMQYSTSSASKIKPRLFCLDTFNLTALRQYGSKSYSGFTEFLEECAGIQEYPGLSTIPHYTTLQKAAVGLDDNLLHKMPSEFILYKKVRQVLAGIDGGGFSYSAGTILHKTSPVAQRIPEGCGMCRHEFASCLCCYATTT